MLFKKFRDDPDTSDWIVLHSLDTARHVRQIEGEADFIVLVPGHGVLCLEVKAGDVKRREGMWIYKHGTERKKVSRSPFKQASEAMHSIRNYVVGKNAMLGGVLFFSAVAFTKIEFSEASAEWHEWQYVAKNETNRLPVSTWCKEILRRAHKHVSTRPTSGWYSASSAKPSSKQIDSIAKILRPDFDYFRLPREEIDELDEELLRYTENQFDALDALEENPRTLFKGLAGTGKTLIALEASRRAAADGKRVLFLCFNKLLGNWLKEQTKMIADDTGGETRCGTLHSVLLATAECDVPNPAGSQFWQDALPAMAIEKNLESENENGVYDVIIVDECQDFNSENYFDFLDLSLSGGLSAGRWVFFGDFDKQAVYGKSLDIPELLRSRCPSLTVFRLTDNCRNVFPVAKSIEFLCSPEPSYKHILHQGSAAEIGVHFFSNVVDQQKKLLNELSRLLRVFEAGEIVVLSSRAEKDCCAAQIAGDADIDLQALSEGGESDKIRFGSIHAYKGLEAGAVVVTDIGSISTDYEQSLLYVGMSRARQQLVLLLDNDCKADYAAALQASLI